MITITTTARTSINNNRPQLQPIPTTRSTNNNRPQLQPTPTPTTATIKTMVVILTADGMMRIGLEMCGFDGRRQNKACRALNLRRFKAHFGSNPIVYAQIWEDLQTTMIPKARIDGKVCVESFLMAILFLKIYPTEEVLSGFFKICERSVRKWVWYYVSKIQALKRAKVRRIMGLYFEKEMADC
jgi:hypothetical protein